MLSPRENMFVANVFDVTELLCAGIKPVRLRSQRTIDCGQKSPLDLPPKFCGLREHP